MRRTLLVLVLAGCLAVPVYYAVTAHRVSDARVRTTGTVGTAGVAGTTGAVGTTGTIASADNVGIKSKAGTRPRRATRVGRSISFSPSAMGVMQAGTGSPMIAAGQLHTLLVKPDGTVWAWGFNDNGQLGDGTTMDSLHPVAVSSLADVRSIASSNAVWAEHSLAVTGAGEV